VELKRELLSLLPNIRLHSFYAMTEAGAVTNLDPEEQLTHPASVGRACAGVEVRIVDDKRNDVAQGETGEIAVRCGEPGRYITMRCYLDPAANAESIVDGWVFTGDMGYFDAEGFLYLVDRKKDMIVSGGFNIYSREVELALMSHPAVLDAAVIGAPDATFGESVVAVIELKPGAKASEDALVAHCKDLIASYKKPKRIYFRALPRNSTGKVQKNLLRDEIAKSFP
jgi:long-chain acyl-CoA synthetase